MSADEHSRPVLKDIADVTADEGNVPGPPSRTGVLFAMAAVLVMALLYLAAIGPSRMDLVPPPKPIFDGSK
jgi:hypothetical protein